MNDLQSMAWAVVSAKYYFLEGLSAGVARSRSSLRPSKRLGRFFAVMPQAENPHRNISPLAPRANTPGAYLRVFAMNRRIDRAMDDATLGWREAAYCLVHEVKPLKPSGHSPPRPSMFRRMKELKMRNTSMAQAFKKVGGENPVSKVQFFC